MHYYTVRNKITGERTLVHAKSRAQAIRGFAERRLAVEFTGQQELVELMSAGVGVLDLSDEKIPARLLGAAGAPPVSPPADGAGTSVPPSDDSRAATP